MKHSRNDNTLLRLIDLVHHDIRQSRHHPFKRTRIVADMAHEWKRDQRFRAAEEPVDHGFRDSRAVLRNPIEDVLEVSERLIVADQLDPLRAKPSDPLARLVVRYQLTVGIGPAAAYFRNLRIGQSHVAHVLHVVEQRAGGSILLSFRQLFDLVHGLFE
jgi:hypothetical protein